MRLLWGVVGALLCMAADVVATRAVAADAAAAERGTIAGKVIDRSSGSAIIEAGVEVVDMGVKTRTDLDGKFELRLSPGRYQLRIYAPLYQGTRLQNIVVRAQQVTKADASLIPEGGAGVEVVEVVAQADKAAEATQLLERQNSAVVSDTIAAETIAKSPDRNAGEVLKRVPAVTMQNDKFVVVRGLGERYSSALLNGSRLPSTDPSKRVVPLDLFPAEFIESLNILKSYTPDLPGDFSGGLVDIRLREFPDRLTYSIGLSTGLNTDSTFRNFQTYHGSDVDYFGFGSDSRSIPNSVPDNLTNHSVPPAQQRAAASGFKNVWSPRTDTAPPNFGVNLSVGDTFGPLGVNFGTIYTTEYIERPNEFQENFTTQGTPPNVVINDQLHENFTFNRSTFITHLGAVLSTGYELTPTDRLSARGFVDRTTSDEVIDGTGHDRNFNDEISQSRLQYREDQLGYGQLQGRHHRFGVDIDWRTALSQATEDEPDTRFITYDLNPAPGITRKLFLAGEGPESSERLFSNLDEYLTDSAVDLTIPFPTRLPFTDVWSGLPAKFKMGAAYAYRNRHFEFRRFLYERNSNGPVVPPDFYSQPPEAILTPPNVGTLLEFSERSRKSDSFDATQDIAAGYGMFDLPLVGEHLRLIAGVRMEYSYIVTDSALVANNDPVRTIINDLSPLPGANLVYRLRDDMNVRYAYSRSVSRPEFRELTPTRFVVPNGERPVIGNQFLVSADIESHDLRWEWFMSPTEVLSFGIFYKDLTNPIEQTVIPESAGEADSFKNAEDATLRGFEFEARKNLGILSPHLLHLTALTNVAYIDSEAHIPKKPGEVQTSTNRALQGQAPYVVNAALEYAHPTWGTARLLYNTIGERIASAGADGLPDIFEQRRDQIDLVLLSKIQPFDVPLTAKFAAENLLNDAYRQTQADRLTHRYRTGVKFTFGLTYSY